MSDIAVTRRFLTRRQQARRWGKSVRTVERWGLDPAMGLPPEYDFNGHPHREESRARGLGALARSQDRVNSLPPRRLRRPVPSAGR